MTASGGLVHEAGQQHDDRRRPPSGVFGLREIGPTFGPLVKAWRTTAAGYSDEELRLLLEFQRKLEDIVRGQLARLRDDLDRHAPSRG